MSRVLYEKRNRIGYMTLNRPEALNALDDEPNGELWRVWDDFAKDEEVDVAIVTDAGKAFCAGADLKLTLTGREVDADEALRLRLVSQVVPHEKLMETAERYAAMMLRNSQQAIRSAKETIFDVVGRSLDDALRLETINAYSSLGDFSEARQRLAQFYNRDKAG